MCGQTLLFIVIANGAIASIDVTSAGKFGMCYVRLVDDLLSLSSWSTSGFIWSNSQLIPRYISSVFRIRSFHQGQNRSLAKCPASLQAVAAAELQYVDLAGASDGHAHIMVEGVQQTCGSYYSTIRTSGFFRGCQCRRSIAKFGRRGVRAPAPKNIQDLIRSFDSDGPGLRFGWKR